VFVFLIEPKQLAAAPPNPSFGTAVPLISSFKAVSACPQEQKCSLNETEVSGSQSFEQDWNRSDFGNQLLALQ
jgi:hypothetical protein